MVRWHGASALAQAIFLLHAGLPKASPRVRKLLHCYVDLIIAYTNHGGACHDRVTNWDPILDALRC